VAEIAAEDCVLFLWATVPMLPSARAPTRSVAVSHPRLAGLTERVERVVDTLDAMLRAGPTAAGFAMCSFP